MTSPMNNDLSNSNANNNDNAIGRKNNIPSYIIEQQAQRLIDKYKNPNGKLLYFKSLYFIDPSRMIEFEKRADTGKQPGRLLTMLLSEELNRIKASSNKINDQIDKFRGSFGTS